MTTKGSIDYEHKGKKKKARVNISGKRITPEVWEDFHRALTKMAKEQYGITVTIGRPSRGSKKKAAKKKTAKKK